MPRFKHVVESNYTPSFRSEKVAGMFDVPVADKLRKEWDIDLPIEERPWKVGLIVGASGSGKTTLARHIFGDAIHSGFDWSKPCFLDDFKSELEVREITETLSKVGFSSPPQWLLPYSVLSNGQKFRAELARCLLEYEQTFVFDEFTSVVDRQVAKVGAFAFQKAVRRSAKRFVAVTCHYDVEEWLQPDWVFDVSTNEFRWGSLRRPEIKLEIVRCSYKAWALFKEHHYLSAEISKAATCFMGMIDGRPVVFDAWIPFFGRLSGNQKGMRVHRTVCLPDFQGLGLGNILTTNSASMWKGLGLRAFYATAHPSLISRMNSSKDWRITGQGRTGKDSGRSERGDIIRAANRLTCRFEYIGEAMDNFDAVRLRAKD